MELIQFGSSLENANFSDIDIAVLLQDEQKIPEISAYLLKSYPNSKIDIAPMYTSWKVPPNGNYHFIIGTRETIKVNERLLIGIDNGIVIEKSLGIG